MGLKDFLELKLGNKLDLSMELIKFDKTKISNLKDSTMVSLNVSLRDLWTLDIKIPYYVADTRTHEKIINKDYDLVKEEKLIRLRCRDSYAKFVIKDISIDIKNNDKIVKCYSIERNMTQRLVLQKNTLQLEKDDVETSEGIFDLMRSELRGWKLGHLDILAKKESKDVGNVNKYRYFDGIEKPWHSFLREEIPSSYDCFCLFDTDKKLINVYDRDTYGNDTGWTISKKNIISGLVKTSNTRDIVTKLYVYGKDGLRISGINPWGDYIFNYDFVKSEMSKELLNALDRYEERSNQLFRYWMDSFNILESLNKQLTLEEVTTYSLQEVIKVKKAEQAILLASSGSTPSQISQIKSEIKRVYEEIKVASSKLSDCIININSFNNKIKTLQKKLDNIAFAMQPENAQTNNSKIFNSELLDELDWYTYVDKQENDVFFTPHALYGWGKDKLKEISKPTIEFKIDSNDFTSKVKEYKGFKQKIIIGDTILIKDEKTGTDKVRFISYTYKPGTTDKIDLTFSTSDRQEEKSNPISTAYKNTTNTKNYLDSKKWEWNEASTQKDFVKELRQNGLNTALMQIFSESNRNRINIDKNGIWITNTDNSNNILVITAGNIVISDDGLQTAKTAIDCTGIYADLLVGKIIAGENLYISNENNDFRITKDGIFIDAKKLVMKFSSGDLSIETKFEILENGFKKSITDTKNQLSNEVIETAGTFQRNLSDTKQGLEARIKATAEGLSLEVDKKVNNVDFGTKIKTNYEAVRISWNTLSEYIEFKNGKLYAKQPDGSYFELGVNGIRKHTSSGDKDVHYLTWITSCETHASVTGIVYINLPAEFRGKDWAAYTSIYDTNNSGGANDAIQKAIAFTAVEDKANNRVGITGYTNVKDWLSGGLSTIGIGARVMVIA